MVMSRGTANGRGYNGDHGSSQKIYGITIPNMKQIEVTETVPQPPMVFQNRTIPRQPRKRIRTAYHTTIFEFEFVVYVTTLHWHVVCPQMPDWKRELSRIEVPASDLWLVLESLAPDLLAESREDYMTSGLPKTSGDGDLGEGNGLVSGVDY